MNCKCRKNGNPCVNCLPIRLDKCKNRRSESIQPASAANKPKTPGPQMPQDLCAASVQNPVILAPSPTIPILSSSSSVQHFDQPLISSSTHVHQFNPLMCQFYPEFYPHLYQFNSWMYQFYPQFHPHLYQFYPQLYPHLYLHQLNLPMYQFLFTVLSSPVPGPVQSSDIPVLSTVLS